MVDQPRLQLLPETFAICALAPQEPLPEWMPTSSFSSISRSATELSVVCDDSAVPRDEHAERGWRGLYIHGELDFSEVGIIARLSTTLAAAEIPVFVVSTFNTDYVLVRGDDLDTAIRALEREGYTVDRDRNTETSD